MIPRISSRDILRRQSRDLRLRRRTSRLRGRIGIANISQLIADTVGDDVWVQSLLLSLVDQRAEDRWLGMCFRLWRVRLVLLRISWLGHRDRNRDRRCWRRRSRQSYLLRRL